MAEALTIVHVYPELLGTYGDRGNALVLARRAAVRGIDAVVVDVAPGEPVPSQGDVYVLGGGEDAAQALAAQALLADDRVAGVLAGAPTLAVCAGLQLLARSFLGPDGERRTGLGLLDVTCDRLATRAVGEVVTDPVGLDLPPLTGYENHRGTARLGPEAQPLGRLVAGVGNGDLPPTGDGGRAAGERGGDVPPRTRAGPQPVPGRPAADPRGRRAAGVRRRGGRAPPRRATGGCRPAPPAVAPAGAGPLLTGARRPPGRAGL